MKKVLLTILALAGVYGASAQCIQRDEQIEAQIESILSKMTLKEKVGQMCELAIDVVSPSPWSQGGETLAGGMLSADAVKTGALLKDADGTYALAANTQYVVTLKPSAAPKNGGYCILKMTYAGDGGATVEEKYCTVALTSDNEFNFTINNGSKAVKCQLIAAWGAPNAASFAGGRAYGSGDTIALNGGAKTDSSSDQNTDSNTVAEPSTAGNSGTSGNDSSDQNTTNSKNSQQSTDKNTDSSGSNTDADSNKSQSGTE